MGGGSSRGLLENEQQKPIDASDIRNGDWEAAKREVIRLRELLSLVDPTKLDRSNNYTPVEEEPSTLQSQFSPISQSTANRSLSRTPPKLYTAQSIDEETEEDNTEPSANKESREGREIWRDPMGVNRQTVGGRSTTGNLSASGGSLATQRRGNKLLAQIQTKTTERFDNLQKAFLKFDSDRSGFISREEFRVALSNVGLPLTDEEFEIINESYPHQESAYEADNGISYVEFAAIMTGVLKYTPGSGEGSDDNYFGKTTTNSMSPYTRPDSSAQGTARPTTGRSDFSTTSTVSRDTLVRMQNTFSTKIFKKFDNMKKAFQKADKDKSGFIEAGEFAGMLRSELGIEASAC